MKFLTDIRLLLIGIWLGAAVFFIGVAQSAFAVLPQRELAGAIVNRTLTILNISGIAVAVLALLLSFVAARNANRMLAWLDRFLLLVVAAGCATGQLIIGFWIASVRAQMGGRPIDEIAADDPLRLQFNQLHDYSQWALAAAMFAALIAFFVIANRTRTGGTGGTSAAAPAVSSGGTTNDPFDFSKPFRKT